MSDHAKVLRKRAEYLRDRIASIQVQQERRRNPGYGGYEYDFAKLEVAALEAMDALAKEAMEAARFLDGIRKRSMGAAAVADRLVAALRSVGLDP